MGNSKNSAGKRIFDDVYSFPQDSQDLADDIHANNNVRVGTSTHRQSTPSAQLWAGVQWVESDTGRIYQWDGSGWYPVGGRGDDVWTNSPAGILTLATGWSLDSFRARRFGGSVAFYVQVLRTGGTIGVPSSGDIANVAIGTLAAGWRPSAGMPLSSGNVGRMGAGYVASDGVVWLTAVGGSGDITNTSPISLGGVIFQ